MHKYLRGDNNEFHDAPENPEGIKVAIIELLAESSVSTDIKKYVSLLGTVGVHQRSLMLLDEAENTLNEVLEVISKNNLSISLEAQNKIRIGHVYQWQKRFERSNLIFEDVIALCLQNEEASHYLHFAYQHHGKNLFDQERYQEAFDFLEKALRIRLDIDAPLDQLQSSREAIDIVKKYLE